MARTRAPRGTFRSPSSCSPCSFSSSSRFSNGSIRSRSRSLLSACSIGSEWTRTTRCRGARPRSSRPTARATSSLRSRLTPTRWSGSSTKAWPKSFITSSPSALRAASRLQ
eukprot:Amastigsp_a678444_12.p7 type:complete len:111 gc:universal Amastigsp_a678444_12:1722-1390(-)